MADVRRAALGAEPGRARVIPAPALDDLARALEDDGLAVARACDAGSLVALATGTAREAGVGAAGLARAALAALAEGRVRVLLLEAAHRADERTATFWWTLAALLEGEDAPEGLLVAACDAVAPGSAWGRAAARVHGLLRGFPPAPGEPGPAEAGRREGSPAGAGGKHAARALRAGIAALLRGDPAAVARAAERAAALAGDDARDLAASTLAALLPSFPYEDPWPLRRALALARLAGEGALVNACELLAAAAAFARGDLSGARQALGSLPGDAVPRALRAALPMLLPPSGCGPDPAGLAAEAEAQLRAGRRALAARLFACAAADAEEPLDGATWERARRIWETADPRAAAILAGATSAGVGGATLPAGAAGIAEALRAAAAAAAAGPSSPGAVLELARLLVPARSAVLLAESDGGETALAARGAASLAGGRLGGTPQVLSLPAGATGRRLVLARGPGDPAFTRDERRLAGAAAELAVALDALAPPQRPPRAAAPPLALGDRLSTVERDVLADALSQSHGNLSRAARSLGLSRNGLKMKLARHGLRAPAGARRRARRP